MRSKFDQQLAALNQELTEMGATCAQAIGLAAQALEQQDVALAAPVGQLEEQTNEQERTIEALCLKLLLQQQPVARDLRQISAALKMITDMERIGDQAADIAEIIPFFLSHNTFDCTLVCRMAQQASSMVTQSVDAFVRRDVYLARSVAGQTIWSETSPPSSRLIAIAREPGQGEVALDLLMIAKYFERIGDHAVNLSEWVEFSVTGVHKHDGVEYE
ncbi:MAG: phosphate signaling complex protein PhoU [Oscillospiraceae bacterium]